MQRIKKELTKAGIPYVSECLGGNIEGLRVGHDLYIVKHGSGKGYYYGSLEEPSDACYTLQDVLDLMLKYKEGERRMTWAEVMDKARHLALHTGTFTDDPAKKSDDMYLVKDIRLVVDAFAKDIEDGKLGSYDDPASFLDAHSIEWE